MRNFVGSVSAGSIALALLLAVSARVEAQSGNVYDEASAMISAVDRAHEALYAVLLADPNPSVDRLEQELYGSALGAVQNPSAAGPNVGSYASSASRLKEVVDRANALRREIFDIYANASVADKESAVEAAVDRYLERSDVALSPVPKSMDILDAERGTTAFRDRYPRANGLYWAFHWWQLAVLEPLIVPGSEAEKEQGVRGTIARFREMVQDPPNNFPIHMPMVPTIAPALTAKHPRAAAIFDNLNLLHDLLVEQTVGGSAPLDAATIERTLDRFTDHDYLAVDELDWIVMSLRHGIYNQGGPAIGRMERSERNLHHHGGHDPGAGGRFPGMGM